MDTSIHGIVFNIQRFSTDDGPGIRTCVFLKGCPLKCHWCHNAESLSFSPELAFFEANCIGCGSCVATCPASALTILEQKAHVDRTKCQKCGVCAALCPSEALCMQGMEMSVDEVVAEAMRDASFFGNNGGITITGGEPMAHPAFTLALAKAAKEQGISVAIETSGYGKTADFTAIVPYCDLFLYDCKASSERHRELIGIEDTLILKNLEMICALGAQVILRCPIVPGANLEDSFLEKIVFLAKKHPQITKVQLMPYHKIGRDKSVTLGKEPQQIFQVPSKEELDAVSRQIRREIGQEVTVS